MIHSKTARIIATLACGRKCDYCVNYQKGILGQIKLLTNPLELGRYNIVLITGGEPTLWPDRLSKLITVVRRVNPRIKVYLYASDYTDVAAMSRLLRTVDGMTYTLHPGCSQLDIVKFQAAQDIVRYGGLHLSGSFRLRLSDDMPDSLYLTTWVWRRIELWRPGSRCVLPEGETLYLLADSLWKEGME